jgi:hypothetical protein
MIAVMLMAVAFFPLMRLFTHAISLVNSNAEMTTALHLAREGMEMVRNRNLPVDRLEALGTHFFPPQNADPITLNRRRWRIRTRITPGTRPLRVDVEVYDVSQSDPLVVLTTLFEDLY